MKKSILFRIREDAAKYVSSALSPAKVNRVFVDDENRTMTVIVPDDQLSLAIGKNGQNVRLAVKLTGWNIDMKSETMAAAQEEGKEGQSDLTKITGVGPAMAEKLFSKGIKSMAMIAATEPGIVISNSRHWREEQPRNGLKQRVKF
ncbi:MAG: helix-hairpin-helix domain-containing protein [Candidatus Moduliflexus flocculans]|nr:helix-hairpin-helix domain-containing protein [Candidatus Moduliflexus flocculans]